jgi:hypothetical protein
VTLSNVLGNSLANIPFTSTTHPVLSAGQQYWLVASMVDPTATAYWWTPNSGDLGLNAASFDGGPFFVQALPRGAFEIDGAAVPEPASVLLCGIGAVTLAARSLRRRPALS